MLLVKIVILIDATVFLVLLDVLISSTQITISAPKLLITLTLD